MKLLELTHVSQLIAHDGHGTATIGSGETFLHYLLEPLHAPLWIGSLVACYLIYRAIRRSRSAIHAAASQQES